MSIEGLMVLMWMLWGSFGVVLSMNVLRVLLVRDVVVLVVIGLCVRMLEVSVKEFLLWMKGVLMWMMLSCESILFCSVVL